MTLFIFFFGLLKCFEVNVLNNTFAAFSSLYGDCTAIVVGWSSFELLLLVFALDPTTMAAPFLFRVLPLPVINNDY